MNLNKAQIIYVLQIFILINILHLPSCKVWPKSVRDGAVKEEQKEKKSRYTIEKTIDTVKEHLIIILKLADEENAFKKSKIDEIHATCHNSFSLLKSQIKEMSKGSEVFGRICFEKLKDRTTYLYAEVQSEIDKTKIRAPERAKRYILKLEVIEWANRKGEEWWEISDNIADQFNMISDQADSFDEFLIELRLWKMSENQSELKRCLERIRIILSELENIINKKYLHEKSFINYIGDNLKISSRKMFY